MNNPQQSTTTEPDAVFEAFRWVDEKQFGDDLIPGYVVCGLLNKVRNIAPGAAEVFDLIQNADLADGSGVSAVLPSGTLSNLNLLAKQALRGLDEDAEQLIDWMRERHEKKQFQRGGLRHGD